MLLTLLTIQFFSPEKLHKNREFGFSFLSGWAS